MTLKQLEYFKCICKYNNFTKAAAELFISQPTLTLAIQQLEDELKVRLFKRQKKSIFLTNEGEVFLERITPILLDIEKLQEDMRYLAEKKNLIRLGVPLMISVPMYPIIFKEFHEHFPEIQIEIMESGAIGIIKNIISENIDIAITSLDEEFSPLLDIQPLFRSYICFCVHKKHPLAKRKNISFYETVSEPLVMFNGDFYINKVIQSYYDKLGQKPNLFLSTSQLSTIKSLISNNIASAFLLEDCILPDENIVAVRLREDLFSQIGIIRKKGAQTYPGTQQIVQFLKRCFLICNEIKS